jgi:hypothetical protein
VELAPLNAGIFLAQPELDGQTLYQYSHDGNPRHTFKVVRRFLRLLSIPDESTSDDVPGECRLPTTVQVCGKAGAPGTYQPNVSDHRAKPAGVLASDIVAKSSSSTSPCR